VLRVDSIELIVIKPYDVFEVIKVDCRSLKSERTPLSWNCGGAVIKDKFIWRIWHLDFAQIAEK
jgi:hypothetical protein